MEEYLTFTTDDGEEIEFAIIEETRINGVNYILVTDNIENEEAEAYILKDVSNDEDKDAVFEMVEEESEIEYIGKVFNELLEDIDVTQ